MFVKFFGLDVWLQLRIISDEGALALPRDDHTVAFELQVSAFDRNHADLEVCGKLSDGRNFLTGRQITNSYLRLTCSMICR